MSYAEMRVALEAVQGDMGEIGHLSASTCKKVDDALKSGVSTAELVSELRKRDGVEVVDAFVKWQREAPNKILIPSIDTEIKTHHCGMEVTAIILQTTE